MTQTDTKAELMSNIHVIQYWSSFTRWSLVTFLILFSSCRRCSSRLQELKELKQLKQRLWIQVGQTLRENHKHSLSNIQQRILQKYCQLFRRYSPHCSLSLNVQVVRAPCPSVENHKLQVCYCLHYTITMIVMDSTYKRVWESYTYR